MPLKEIDKFGRTPLHYVAVDLPPSEHGNATRRLIEQGSDPNAVDKQGWTPLHFAAQEWSEASARVLIENGAGVDAPDNHGNTPLWRAVLASQGRGELITLLLKAGADPDRMNNHGISPRNMAKNIGNYNVSRWFEGV